MTAVTGIYRIGKQFEFQATRTRDGVPDGSGFLVEATLTASALTGPGFVVDFGQLAPLKRYLDQTFDHRNLDDVLGAGRAGNTQVAMHLEAWCRANLHEAAAGRLERVTVRCGRPAGQGPHDLAFSAQHRLRGLPEGHKCGRDHGHTYLVGVLPGQVTPPDGLRRLVAALDGTVLNEVLDTEPTSESLARHLLRSARAQGAARLEALRVSETATSWAQYSEQT
jgi:6-pyruvoyltetrahydropterin/6-carboxytetrahydropterin synthase